MGGIGFTLCGALGFGAADPSVEYAATLATFVGSWAFLVSPCVPDPPGVQRVLCSGWDCLPLVLTRLIVGVADPAV